MKQHASKCAGNIIEGRTGECNCDSYHTFDELYEHRITLFIALCRILNELKREGTNRPEDEVSVWCSTLHHDGSSFGDWFIMGIGKEKGQQITYHLPARFWEYACEVAEVLDRAPEFDGHTSDDVLERLKRL